LVIALGDVFPLKLAQHAEIALMGVAETMKEGYFLVISPMTGKWVFIGFTHHYLGYIGTSWTGNMQVALFDIPVRIVDCLETPMVNGVWDD
jgi:hypothetical protein